MTLTRLNSLLFYRSEILEQLLTVDMAFLGMELHAEDVLVCDTGGETISMFCCAHHDVFIITLEVIGMHVIET